MSSNNKAANAGAGAGNAVSNAFHKIHGAGEAIRGNINTFADNVTRTDSSHSEAVTQRGLNEMDGAKVGRQTQAPLGTTGAQQTHAGPPPGAGNTAHAANVGHSGDMQNQYGAPGVQQYGQAGNQTGQGQSGRGLAQAMNDGSGANRDAASGGGVYEGGRPL